MRSGEGRVVLEVVHGEVMTKPKEGVVCKCPFCGELLTEESYAENEACDDFTCFDCKKCSKRSVWLCDKEPPILLQGLL